MTVTLRAYAKINLSLDITGKREDGYHYIESLMQNISLFDTVTVTAVSDPTVIVKCGNIENENNICFKAAKLFLEESKINTGVFVDIKKNIPVSGGMGGGSADAAAVLVALNKIFSEPLGFETLNRIALKLGADVPFFLTGGTAKVSGIGEIIKKVNCGFDYTMLIIKNSEKQSTKEMYKKLDAAPFSEKMYTAAVCKAIETDNFTSFYNSMGNDFESLWNNDAVKKELYALGAKKVSLSGSGPVIFAIFDSALTAERAYSKLKNNFEFIYTAFPSDKALEFV